ncbi:MAG: hypothetical protein AMXMBFR13_03720 [Phycisphaerae bacterium]
MRHIRNLSIGLGLLLVAESALAHDLLPPAWRGQPDSTFQEWAFSDAADPAPATNATYGSPSADIAVGPFGSGWLHQLPGLGTQTGYWDLGSEGSIMFDLDAGPSALPIVEVWVQVTYFDDLTAAPTIDVPGAALVPGSAQTALFESDPISGAWMLDKSVWTISPNPGALQMILTATTAGATIDHVIIDTRAVPEPHSLLALVWGGAVLCRRWRV